MHGTVLLADQFKAYEVMLRQWMTRAWAEWRISFFVFVRLVYIVIFRYGQILVGGHTGDIIAIIKGLGIGGPHAPFVWNVSFDPVMVLFSVCSQALAMSVSATWWCFRHAGAYSLVGLLVSRPIHFNLSPSSGPLTPSSS